MRSITFYSYKGGVGRTLALANVAHYLAQLGQTVVAADFDLEAPGLDYKLKPRTRPSYGLVDLVYEYMQSRRIPPASEWLSPVWTSGDGGSIHLLSSGLTISPDYWRRFASIDWRNFLVGDDRVPNAGGEGLPFFLELKEQIAATLRPDFLLMDARTGITELGGIASTILPDDLVCFFVRNEESIEGTREILRALDRASRLPSTEGLRIFPILARLPELSEEAEHAIIADVGKRLDLEAIKSCEPIMIVHSYPDLQVDEHVLMSDENSIGIDSQLYADYARFFNRILPFKTVEASLQSRIEDAQKLAYQNPTEAHKLLVKIARRQPHARSYRALLQFYRLRSEKPDKLLESARKLAEITNDYGDELIWGTLTDILGAIESDPTPAALSLVERAWNARGAVDVEIGMKLADAWEELADSKHAAVVLSKLVESVHSVDGELLAKLINTLVRIDAPEVVLRLSPQVKRELRTPALQRAWGRAITVLGDKEEAIEFLDRADVGEASFYTRPSVWFELLRLAGRADRIMPAAERFADGLIEIIRAEGLNSRVRISLSQLYEVFDQVGKAEQLMRRARESLPRASQIARFRSLERRLQGRSKEREED